MKKRVVAMMLALVMTASLSACGSGGASAKGEGPTLSASDADKDLDYEYGEGETFHSEEPVTYTMAYSDHENYPFQADWRLWSAIEEKSNVTFKTNNIARTDYNDKISAMVNSGSAPYIIPKVYDAAAYVAGGQVVPISDWVQYMPNYMKSVEDWGMEAELTNILSDGGKYYRLPGMWEKSANGFSMMIRKDIFEAAGVDVREGEKTWTWEDFYEACKKVKEFTGADYVWSDQYQLGCSMNLSAVQYGVKAGKSKDGGDWGLKNGTVFNFEDEKFEFGETTPDYKEYLTFWNKMYNEGILDPDTFVQDSNQAQAKFFRGESYVLTCNYQLMVDIEAGDKMQADGAELYYLTTPGGPKGQLQVESSRLENGIMISQNALDELGEEGFIKMLRFIDWLWYSDEGQMLSQWGIEGETYTKGEDGSVVLNPDIYFNGINPGAEKQLNADYGFAGGVFAYGGSTELRFSKCSEAEKEWNKRIYASKTPRKIEPPILANEDEKEEMDLIQVPLLDYVNTSALEFITGKLSLDHDWDAYVEQCESLGSTKFIDQANEIFDRTKDVLGYK